MAYEFDKVRDDGAGGVRFQWTDDAVTPKSKLTLTVQKDGKLSMAIHDKEKLGQVWESRTNAGLVVSALRGLLEL